MRLRIPIFFALMGFIIYLMIETDGVVDRIGMVFVTICILTTSIAILFGAMFAPGAWCSFCPTGTLQRIEGGRKYQLRVDREKCID
ncbi:MAG TPA: hypothetical protein PKY93_04315 [Methanothrix sp.]|nr:hypothetical protein [Methanothrix sp.]HPC89535.1 hypothetical protein [Methanothrix sp.]HQI68013.1 hypothetical protein [Methanothrix sp.]HRS84856.1 hypothetical protein [Methanothrix sp.]HRT16967.1 hypothetical protein [Methanothrix sp.]